MRAVLIAATLAAIAAPAFAAADIHVTVTPTAPGVLGRAPTAMQCQVRVQKATHDGSVQFKRLDELPWGLVEHAVLRSVGGCPVREVVYQGQVYWVEPAVPGVTGRVEPLIGQRLQRQK